MPNLIDYLLEDPKRTGRIMNYMIGFLIVTEVLWIAYGFAFVKK